MKKTFVPEIPYGTYGIWDYPCKQWQTIPTLEDIPEIVRQKRLRAPAEEHVYWSEKNMPIWFKAKG